MLKLDLFFSPKVDSLFNEHIVKNHSFWIILKDFIIPADYNFAFYALLFASLFFFWGFFYVRKELKKLNQQENSV